LHGRAGIPSAGAVRGDGGSSDGQASLCLSYAAGPHGRLTNAERGRLKARLEQRGTSPPPSSGSGKRGLARAVCSGARCAGKPAPTSVAGDWKPAIAAG